MTPVLGLRAFVARARRWALFGTAVRIAAIAVLSAAGLALVAVWTAGWTLRGDLTQPGWLALVGLGTLAVAVVEIRRGVRRFGTLPRCALAIARTRRPLGPGAAADGDRRLRQEVLGAFDLIGAGSGRAGSATLRHVYVGDVEARLRDRGATPRRALPAIPVHRILAATIVLGVFGSVLAATSTFASGWPLWLEARDGRPAPPPEPVWSSLTLGLTYPAHTDRPPHTMPNPSGALRVPAGTEVAVELVARSPASAAALVVVADPTELSLAPAPERVVLEPTDAEGLGFRGRFVVRGSGTWTVALLDDEDEEPDAASRRSAALPVQLEPDRAPEIEVIPLGPTEQSVRDAELIDVRWHAKDDFGIVAVELVYQLPDGTTHRLGPQAAPAPTRSWRHKTTWDIAAIPVASRSEVLYWLEVRDNDPGLGIDPLPDGPGKVTRSSALRLQVEDEQAEHAQNILGLRELRDRAVDSLAERLVAVPFEAREPKPDLVTRVALARELHEHSGALLAQLAASIDALSIDALAQARDAEILGAIHRRLLALHQKEATTWEALPPEGELDDPATAERTLGTLAAHNVAVVTQLEDEIIRLDDMVDGMVVEQLEALVARLEATQRKLVELLEQLQAGDESVRAQIEQLEQRRREDLRRLSEARALLREEIEQEFMNLDAFAILQQIERDEQLQAMLQRGEVERALEQARGQLDEVQRLRDQVQERAGEAGAGAPELTEEERQRIALLRELSRLQDEEASLRGQTQKLHKAWRDAVAETPAEAGDAESTRRKAEALREQLESINDARLGRDARRGLDDAKAALERLRATAEGKAPKALEIAEAADAAADGIARALAGAERAEGEGKALERADEKARALREAANGRLPGAREVLTPEQRAQFDELRERQDGVRERASELLQSELAKPLPQSGRAGMRRADGGMGRSLRGLEGETPRDAISGQSQAWSGLQEAIDSLRRGSPPPPPSASGDASTEAERDRSLRDELLDAMREDAPPGFADPVRRYYEELLR